MDANQAQAIKSDLQKSAEQLHNAFTAFLDVAKKVESEQKEIAKEIQDVFDQQRVKKTLEKILSFKS